MICKAASGDTNFCPRHKTFASLCCRASFAICSFTTKAARTPGTLFAAMLIPTPEAHTSNPNRACPLATCSATDFAKSG